MTMRTYTKLKCECGQTGEIIESENDQPYSKEWSMNSLRSLGSEGTYTGPNQLFSEMHPSCISCGRTLTPNNIVR